MANWNTDRGKRPGLFPAPAARPGDYPLWSIKSRAAARAMVSPMNTVEQQWMQKVLETLSNAELNILNAYITLLRDGKQHEPIPDQQGVLDTFFQRLDEIRNTGKLTAQPWGS